MINYAAPPLRATINKKRLAIALDTTLGWRSVHRIWRDLYPPQFELEAHWIDLAEFSAKSKTTGKKTKLQQMMRRVQMTRDVNLAMRRANADAALIGNMALNLLADNGEIPIFTMIDATQQQLHSFSGAYGIYPSKIKLLEDLKHRIRCRAYQRCTGVFSFSQWAANSLVENYGVNASKVHVVPPGVDVQRWQASNHHVRAGGVCNILFVGGDFERKGGAILLDWVRRTKEKNWHLHIVTKSPVFTDSPFVTVYDDVAQEDPKLTQLFAFADIFVLPTIFDCSSIAIQEALAAGLPVVTSNVGGLSELVIEGTTGYAIRAGNQSMFAEKVELLIGDAELRLRMSQAATQDARLRFDGKANMLTILNVIADVAQGAEDSRANFPTRHT